MAIAQPRVIARNIVFTIDGDDVAPEVNSVELTLQDAPGGVQTFSEVRVHSEWQLAVSGFMSPKATSLYSFLWTNFGTEVPFKIVPGGGTEGTDNPAYTGTVIINELPPLTLTSNEEVSFTVNLRVKNTGLDVASKLFYGVTVDTSA